MITMSSDAHVVVADVAGTPLVETRMKANDTVDMGLKAGVYVVKAVSGKAVAVKKVIIK